ncbi:glucose-induced degradation protein 8-A homolog isoform X1 [Ictalurus furcatus]|nr:glucose-induced degradation protein 8-A homolog isoform X1 [Ictalurus furcatus]
MPKSRVFLSRLLCLYLPEDANISGRHCIQDWFRIPVFPYFSTSAFKQPLFSALEKIKSTSQRIWQPEQLCHSNHDITVLANHRAPLKSRSERPVLSRDFSLRPSAIANTYFFNRRNYSSDGSMMSYAEKPEDVTKEEWMEKLNNVHIQRADMNRLIMNYLVTEGFKEAAEKFRMESGIEPSVDLDSLDERIKIREMILKGQIQEAISLINSLHPELLDTNRYLYFHLQQQHLIELIRLRETEAALEFAQSQLAEQGEESRECLTEMERTLALLAFDNPEESPFGDLLNMMQRQKVWSEVNQAVLDYENRESTPKLAKLLKLLLWAQNELDQKKVKYPKMTDLSKGTIEDPK